MVKKISSDKEIICTLLEKVVVLAESTSTLTDGDLLQIDYHDDTECVDLLFKDGKKVVLDCKGLSKKELAGKVAKTVLL